MLVGALVQGVVGIGLGLIGAPVVTLVQPDLMPGFLLVLATLMPMVTLRHEHSDIDWRGLGWALPTRVLGTALGVWLVAILSDRVIGIAVGVMVLVAVAITVRAVEVPVTRSSLATAGFVSGVTGTATSIGGPPLVILYQHRPPRQVRTTMAVYFMVGAALSLVGLLITGELTRHQVLSALLMIPALVLGGLLAGPVRARLGGPAFRVAVLVVCAVSATALLVRSLAA